MAKKPKKKKRVVERRIVLTAENFETIGKLASVGCSQEEIVSVLAGVGMKISVDTLQRRMKENPAFRQAYEAGLAQRNVKLRSRMFQQAMMMNGAGVHQSQFLAVNWLNMKHKFEHKHDIEATVELTTARERVAAKLEAISKRLAGRAAGERSEPLAQMVAIPFRGGSNGD